MKNINLQLNLEQTICSHLHNTLNGDLEVNIPTEIKIKASKSDLHISFKCLNNPYISDNHYIENNSEMWRQEVFEVFIADSNKPLSRYFEFELNPNNAIFCAHVNNPNLKGNSLNLEFLDPIKNNIQHTVNVSKDSYFGELIIPLTLLDNTDKFRVNFYRIVATEQPTSTDWQNNEQNSKYLAYNPTNSGKIAQFHLPEQMISMTINNS